MKFGRRNLNYDIALLRLKKPAMMNDYVNTVCVPGETEKVAVGSNCYITGKKHTYFLIIDCPFPQY